MKRTIGSIAAMVMALSLGVSAFAGATPKNSARKAAASTSKPSTIKARKNKKRNRRLHHKTRRSLKTKSQVKVKNTGTPQK